jgi:hypothetical protein
MPRAELKKTHTKHDIKNAMKNHVRGLYRSMKAKNIQIKNFQSQLASAREERDDLRKAWALASKNVSYYESENF